MDLVLERDGHLLGDRILGVLKDGVVEGRLVDPVVARTGAVAGLGRVRGGHVHQQAGQVQQVGLRMVRDMALAQEFCAADDLLDGADAQAGENPAHLLRHAVEEVHDHVGRALELGPEAFVLAGDADGAGVEVALAHIDAPECDQGRRAEVELLGAQDGRLHDVNAGAHAAVGAEHDAVAEVVHHEDLLGLGDAQFPGRARVLDRREGRGARAAVVARNQDDVGVRLGDAGGDRAHAGFGDELDADLGAGIDLLQVVDELGQILDRIDVVVRRGRNEHHPRHGVAQTGDQGGDLVAGELAALAGLGALGHLDFNLLRTGQISRRHTEAAAGHLFDRGVGQIAVFAALETFGILAAFSGVGLAPDAVHRDGEGLVGFRTEGAQRHAGGGEPLADVLDGLDFFQRHGLRLGHQLEHVLEGDGLLGFNGLDVLFVVVGVVGFDERVEGLDDGRGHRVALPGAAEAVVAGILELGVLALGRDACKTLGVAGERFGGDLGEANARDLRGGAVEAAVHHGGVDADGLEDLRAMVARKHGDAHLGHDLQKTVLQRLAHVFERLLVGDGIGFRLQRMRLGQLVAVYAGLGHARVCGDAQLVEQFARGFQGEVGADRAGAVADEAGELVGVAGLARFTHDAGLHAAAGVDQVVVHRAGGQQHRDGHVFVVHPAVRQDQDAGAGLHGGLGLLAEPAHGLLQSGVALGQQPGRVERGVRMVLALEVAQRFKLVLQQHRRIELDEPRVLGGLGQQVAPPA